MSQTAINDKHDEGLPLIEIVDLFESPLDPALLEVPKGFRLEGFG